MSGNLFKYCLEYVLVLLYDIMDIFQILSEITYLEHFFDSLSF